MTKEELIRRLQDIEWEDFEVKEAKHELPKNIWETVSAFSNTSGGWIILGIKQRGRFFEVQGVENAEKLEQDFTGTLRSQKFNIRLSTSLRHYDIEGKKILAFYVPSSSRKPVYFGNPSNSFVRMGSGDQRATESEIMTMYHDQSFGIRSELAIPDTDFSMLDINSVRSYRNHLSVYNVLTAYEGLDDEAFCRRLAICTQQGELTYAGLLMFGAGEEVLRHVPTFCMDYIEIPGKSVKEASTRYTYRIPEQENLWEVYQVVIRRLFALVDKPFKMNNQGVAEDDNRQFEVLREAWVNMLMHTDHFSPLRSCVRVFTDRIEFLNAGSFPVPPERIYGTFFSQARNPSIAKFFRFAKLAENAGFGLDKLRSWQALTKQRMSIRDERDYVLITLGLKNGVVENVVENLSDRQQLIVDLLKKNNTLSAGQIAGRLSVTERTIQRDLNELKRRRIILHVGPMKGGFWKIMDDQ